MAVLPEVVTLGASSSQSEGYCMLIPTWGLVAVRKPLGVGNVPVWVAGVAVAELLVAGVGVTRDMDWAELRGVALAENWPLANNDPSVIPTPTTGVSSRNAAMTRIRRMERLCGGACTIAAPSSWNFVLPKEGISAALVGHGGAPGGK